MKKLHPVRKMVRRMTMTQRTGTIAHNERVIARHVKPLLYALEVWHKERLQYERVLEIKQHQCKADTCRLLAEWMAKL